MASKKISDLPAATTVTPGTDVLPIVQGTVTSKVTPQQLVDAAVVTMNYATGGGTATGINTGDQASIVGISGTLAEFNVALTDAEFVTGGGTVAGTNTGDDAVNTLYSDLVTNATHTGDVTGSEALTIADKAVTLAKMADMAASSLIYRKTASDGVPEVNTLATLKTDLDVNRMAIDEGIFGFMPTVETTIAFDDTTYVFTLGVLATTFSYYRAGLKYTITGAKAVTLPGTPPTATKYYIYIDSTDGTLIQSTTPWNLADTKVPVVSISFNTALAPKYLLCDERHPCDITRGEHRAQHFTQGTQVSVIPTITTLTPSSDNLVSKRPTLTLGALFDESLYIANAALTPAGNPYTATDYAVMYRTAASTWAWKKSSMPFPYNGSTNFIQWDNNGTLTDGAGGTGGNARWFNSYLVQTDVVNDGLGYVWIPGRGSFTSLALAQAEDPATFTMTGFPILEYAISMQLTWAINATYTSAGKCVYIAQKQVKTGNIITGYTAVVLAPSATIDTTQVVYSIAVDTTAAADGAKPTIYLVSGTTTLTLPTAIGNNNRYTVVNVGANTVTLATTSAQTINGSAPGTLANPYDKLTVISDGANWVAT